MLLQKMRSCSERLLLHWWQLLPSPEPPSPSPSAPSASRAVAAADALRWLSVLRLPSDRGVDEGLMAGGCSDDEEKGGDAAVRSESGA